MRRPLYGWLGAQGISLIGTRLSMIAIPWLVLTTTGSATRTGAVAFAELAPLVLVKALGGPVIDRLGARRVAIACDLLSVLAVGLIPLTYAEGLLSFPLLLALVAVAGALRGPGDAAKAALVPQIVDEARVPMERVTGLESGVERTASTLGAALAGGLVALLGPAQALLVDAGSFGLSAAVLAWSTRLLPPDRHGVDGVEEGSVETTAYWAQLRGGAAYLRRDSLILSLAVMVAVTNLLDLAWSAVLVPVWADDSGRGAGAVGLVFAVFSAGSIAGSLMAAAWGDRLPRFRLYVVAFLVTGLPRFLVLALDSPLWLVIGVFVVGGVLSGFLNPILGAVLYERIPRHLLGRVSSLTGAMAWGLMPFGGLLGGLAVAGVGLSPAMLAIGVAYFVATMAPTVLPAFREMDDRPAVAPDRVPEHAP